MTIKIKTVPKNFSASIFGGASNIANAHKSMNKSSNLFVLIILGLIWSTFAIFTKISVEVLSPFFVGFARLAIGSVMLCTVIFWQRKKFHFGKNFKHYLIVGFFNSALPFILFSLAARSLDSGVVAILDGTIPMFEVLISMFVLRRHVDKSAMIGVTFGMIGVIVTSCGNSNGVALSPLQIIAIISTLCACVSYAAASIYISDRCKHIDSINVACGSVTFAAMILLPSLFFADLSVIDFRIGMSLLGLGGLCTGIAYILYFKLAAEESARTTVSVVLLIPFFGTLIGVFFAGEQLTISKIIGCLAILVSMKFILNLSRKNFFKSKEAHIL